jgi:Transposase domain (DUF772)
VIKRIKRAKLFVWLRQHRHELFDEDLQAELAQAFADKPVGQPPVPPAQLGLATILQAYTGASDDEVIEATVMDRRWQLVLDCMDHATAPFSKTTLVAFRARLIAHDLDRRLVERTVALYGQATGRVAAGKLRARRVRKCVHAARRYSWRRPPSRSRRCTRVRWLSLRSVGEAVGSGGSSSSARCGRWAL